MQHQNALRSSLIVIATISGVAVSLTAAPVAWCASAPKAWCASAPKVLCAAPPSAWADETNDAATIVRVAIDRIGGARWREIASFESVATAKSVMGDARIEYQFVAPNSHRLTQTMPGGEGVMEMGFADGIAWIGEPGQAKVADPKMAQELAGGGDLQTLLRTIETRFSAFTTIGREKLDGKNAWKIAMIPAGNAPRNPAATPASAADAWIIYIESATGIILGIDIPAPPQASAPRDDSAAQPPAPTGQSIRFSNWKEVERGTTDASTASNTVKSAGPSTPLRAFRNASVSAGGMTTELVYDKVAVNTLSPNAIRPPAEVTKARQTR